MAEPPPAPTLPAAQHPLNERGPTLINQNQTIQFSPGFQFEAKKKINQNSNSQGGLGTSTSFHFYLHILIKKNDVEVIATFKTGKWLSL